MSPISAHLFPPHLYTQIDMASFFWLKDGIKGFASSFVYWLLILLFLFVLDLSFLDKILLICCAFGVVGGVAGSVWKINNRKLPIQPDDVSPSSFIKLYASMLNLRNIEPRKRTNSRYQAEVDEPYSAIEKGIRKIQQFVLFVLWALNLNSSVEKKKESLESRFWFWLLIGLLATTLWGLNLYPSTYPLIQGLIGILKTAGKSGLVFAVVMPIILSVLSGVVVFITVRLGIAASKTSRYIFTWVNNLPGRQVGVIGVSLTLIGFLIQIIEPFFQFWR